MNPIPVIGTAIVNSPHWITRLIDSIDYPVDNFVVFNNNGRGQITKELDEIIARPHPFINIFIKQSHYRHSFPLPFVAEFIFLMLLTHSHSSKIRLARNRQPSLNLA